MKWSIEEEKFLEENYKLISDEEIAKYLGRTLSSARGKVNFEKAIFLIKLKISYNWKMSVLII